MSANLNIGDKIRPWGGINYGTLGFFCTDDNHSLLFATCDHVIKTLSTPDQGPQKIYFPFGNGFTKKIAVFEGQSLVTHDMKIADIGLAKVVVDVEFNTLMPAPIPSTEIDQLQRVISPTEGEEVMLWGARTATYHSGVILKKNSSHAWPHAKYGLIRYEKQFSIAIGTQFTPEVGDSGGYVITPDGSLVGIVAALSGTVSDAGNAIIHCVPVKECCELLGVEPITNKQ